jgi:cellulose synthase/poly-beta-1,6-N-acetylglucosamine synthase-like glycosyltransferase
MKYLIFLIFIQTFNIVFNLAFPPKVSIIVPIYNLDPEILNVSITSLIDQSLTEIEMILVDDKSIRYTSITKIPGQDEEKVEEKVIDDKEIIDKFMSSIYLKHKVVLKEIYENVNKLDKLNRSKNTATNDLSILDNGVEMSFDCYVQEYENIPSLFTVEVEKFINEIK